jgi:double zinc ribbon protein
MDELDRLFERLVQVLSRDVRLAVPFPAADVYERLVPYRSNRSHLRVATHQDYEMTVLRLLAGERGYVRLEPDDVRDAMQREITAINPDPAMFRSFPDARLMINRLAAERFLRGEAAYAPPAETAADEESDSEEEPVALSPSPPAAATPADAGDGAMFELAEDEEAPGRQCAYCGGMLPRGRKINFCPHCGQPPSGEELKCPACGAEVDVGWAYCVSCGRGTGFE